MSVYPAPPFDPELAAALLMLREAMPAGLTAEMIPLMREASVMPPFDDFVGEVGAVHVEHRIAGHEGDEILVSIYRPAAATTQGPGILHLHGGGMVMGDRFTGVPDFLPYVASHGAVIVSVEYRLAPEYPDPYPVEDCYAALLWTAEHANELGIDATRLIVAGPSAGGGLAAGVALLARDRGGPELRALAVHLVRHRAIPSRSFSRRLTDAFSPGTLSCSPRRSLCGRSLRAPERLA